MKKYWIIFIIALSIMALGLSAYNSYNDYNTDRFDILERSDIDKFSEDLLTAAGSDGFASQDDLSSFIKSKADASSLEYTEDASGNLIFEHSSYDEGQAAAPTVIITGMNFATALSDIPALSTAMMAASYNLDPSGATVIFINDELSFGYGYKYLSSKYIPEGAQVFVIGTEESAGIRTDSFCQLISEIKLPVEAEEPNLDSAVKLHIGGIKASAIDPDISDKPSPLDALSTILSTLKNRSVEYRIAELNLEHSDNMQSSTLDVTIMLNSYSEDILIKRLERIIKNWNRDYSSVDSQDFTYELIEDEDSLPSSCYDRESTDLITDFLYSFNIGVYTFGKNDTIPEGFKDGDIYGYNIITELYLDAYNASFKILSQALNEDFLSRIETDNQAVAELIGCTYSEIECYDPFSNPESKLSDDFRAVYVKINDLSDNKGLKLRHSDRFIPCSYLGMTSPDSDIIYLCVDEKSAFKVCNSLLCYIKFKDELLPL